MKKIDFTIHAKAKVDARRWKNDTQRQKVYEAERSVSYEIAGGLGEERLTAYWNSLKEDAWIEQRFGVTLEAMSFEVRNLGSKFLGNCESHASQNEGGINHRIRISKGASELIVLHELAHAVFNEMAIKVEYAVSFRQHGPGFCLVYHLLVEHYLGKSVAYQLMQAFRKEKVQVLKTDGTIETW